MLILYAHALPWMLLLSTVGRFTLQTIEGAHETATHYWDWTMAGYAFAGAFGIAGGVSTGSPAGLIGAVVGGTAFGTAMGVAEGMTGALSLGLATGILVALTAGIAEATPSPRAPGDAIGTIGAVVTAIAGGVAGGIMASFAFGIAYGVYSGIAATTVGFICLTRAWDLALGALLVSQKIRPQQYSWHPVAWDELCSFAFPRLDLLLVALTRARPAAGRREIIRIIRRCRCQRRLALRAWKSIVAPPSGTSDLWQLVILVEALGDGNEGPIGQNNAIHDAVAEIASLQNRVSQSSIPALRAAQSGLLLARLDNLVLSVDLPEPVRTEFRSAANPWIEKAREQQREAISNADRQLVAQVFRAGDPIDADQEAFVSRQSVYNEILQEIIEGKTCPALILYSRRRRGKTTLIRNLARFVPEFVRCGAISMQDARVFSSFQHLLAALSKVIDPEVPSPEDLPRFAEVLDLAEEKLRGRNHRVLVAIDEYEGLDSHIPARFPLEFLDVLRHSIQTHRHIIWMFVGSHHITELVNASWPSYLISARTIWIPNLTFEETTTLLTDPMRTSALWQGDGLSRPKFEPDFWGEQGIERIWRETAGWPHLVQLVARNCVKLLNDAGERIVRPTTLDQAFDEALRHPVFDELVRIETKTAAEYDYLLGYRKTEWQREPESDAVRRSLRNRELIREQDGNWQMAAPIMRRWLQKIG